MNRPLRITLLLPLLGSLHNLIPTVGFRCYSEYEFNWWDADGDQHKNGFSMSHFQLKMNSYLRAKSTYRPPLKEAFFLVRLHPSYIANLTDECPHALVSAHFLVSIFYSETGLLELAMYHYQAGLHLFNHSPRVHQEVTLYAWPMEESLNLVELSLSRRASLPRNITFVFLSNDEIPESSGAQIPLHLLGFFDVSRAVIQTDQASPWMSNFSFVHFWNGTGAWRCDNYLSILRHIPQDWYPVVFVDWIDLSESLLANLLRYVIHSDKLSLPPLYSLGHARSLPRINNHRNTLKGGYSSNSFFVGTKLDLAECDSETSVSLLIESVVHPQNSTSLYHPLRCDDESLPLSLRLCEGTEHVRIEWRSCLVAPVIPRSPVLPFN